MSSDTRSSALLHPKPSISVHHFCLSSAHTMKELLSLSLCQDDMHRVIDQQLMDKHQEEWRHSPRSFKGSRGGEPSRRSHRLSDGDKRLFSFFKKNWWRERERNNLNHYKSVYWWLGAVLHFICPLNPPTERFKWEKGILRSGLYSFTLIG